MKIPIEGQGQFVINTPKTELNIPAVTRRKTSALVLPDKTDENQQQIPSGEETPQSQKEWTTVPADKSVTLREPLYQQLKTPGVEATIEDPKNPGQAEEVILPRSFFMPPATPGRRRFTQPVLGSEVSVAKTRIPKEPKKTKREKPIEPGKGKELPFPDETRFFTRKPRTKLKGETDTKRKEFLNKSADWKIQGATLRVRKKDVADRNKHWYMAQIIELAEEDLGKLSRDGTVELKPGQLIRISKYEYIKARQAQETAKQAT